MERFDRLIVKQLLKQEKSTLASYHDITILKV